MLRLIARLSMAAVTGAVIAWVIVAIILYVIFAAGGYTSHSLARFSFWGFCFVGGSGALSAIALVYRVGDSPLPFWVKPVIIGALIGIAVIVVATVFTSSGRSSKDQARYSESGLFYGVPIGVIGGALMGLMYACKLSAEQRDPPDHSGA